MERSDEKARGAEPAELPLHRLKLDSHVENYYHEGRGINYFTMLMKLPPDQMTKVQDLFKEHYPADCPRIESYSKFFQLVDRLDRDKANEVLDLINGFHHYGGVKPEPESDNNKSDNNKSNNNTQIAAASSSAASTSATSPAAYYERTSDSETNISAPGYHEHKTKHSYVTYTVRGSRNGGGPTAVVSGLPDTDVQPARVAEAMEAVSQIMGGLHQLVSLTLRKERRAHPGGAQ
ncbi:hypothetical protein F4821DRAFT_96817 [Hypoxylon rubiginosum]|uniref:Uncharacterized protein n=1 Tax=Hypoxylon rubiginosum TaxID=110542 RepID=A0ACC0D634_9PEZI|nr:hypothetical protein F4821DRAFT_96817 [Hypoxylon rubiginosum]